EESTGPRGPGSDAPSPEVLTLRSVPARCRPDRHFALPSARRAGDPAAETASGEAGYPRSRSVPSSASACAFPALPPPWRTVTTPALRHAERDRYREIPSVLTALRSPRLLVREVLAGLVVAIALIPEAISFSIIAGVDPRVGLFSSFVMAMAIAFVGGRPAMITAATAAVAVVVAPVAREHGLDHLIATVILGGIFQVLLAWFGVARLMRFIPRS